MNDETPVPPRSTVRTPVVSPSAMPRVLVAIATGVAALPVLLPMIELAARFAILPKVTAPFAIVAATDPGPVAVTSPVSAVM